MTSALSLLPLAQQLFVDGNNVPLAGGRVTFYVPNTQTYATVYSDAQGVNPLPNPCTLDADGYAQPTGQIWGSGSFRQIVQDALGNTIWDNVTSAIAISAAMIPVLEAPTTSGAAVLLGLGEGVIIPCGATLDGTALALTRNANTNPVYAAALGTFFVFTAPATATGPFTLSETTDDVPSATLYDSLGTPISQLEQNQFCIVGWNPDFGSSGGWVLLFAPQGAQSVWYFTTPGTNTWVAPQGINTIIYDGAGAGGAGGNGEAGHAGGGGGGGGAASTGQTLAVSAGGTYQVFIGSGGATVSGAAGAPGTATTFISSSFSTLAMLGPGLGGAFGNTTGPGATVPGGAAGGAGGVAGQPGYFANADTLSFGGQGGGTNFGPGGAAGPGGGQTPPGYGGGGGGGAGTIPGAAGANGYFKIQLP